MKKPTKGSRYKTGDKVWLLDNNRVVQASVHDYLVSGSGAVWYWLLMADGHGNRPVPGKTFSEMDTIDTRSLYTEGRLFETKQKLINSL